MKLLLLIFTLFPALPFFAQKNVLFKAKILNNNNQPVEGVHIQNLNTQQYAVSDKEGYFAIEATEGNMLQLTHVAMQTLFYKLKERDFQLAEILIHMQGHVIDIDEVTVEKYQKINAKDLGIIQQDIVQRSFNEKRLIAATKNESIVLRLINSITGRTKMLKTIVANDENKHIASYIRNNFSDFLKREFKLTDEDVELLSYFVMEKTEFHRAVNAKQNTTIQFMLLDAWLEYQNMIKEEETEVFE